MDLGTGLLEVASAEDTLLEKLVWFRLGGGVSDRQWGDVLGILRVQRQRLDFDYLATWAESLGLSDLLHRAYRDAGLPVGRGG